MAFQDCGYTSSSYRSINMLGDNVQLPGTGATGNKRKELDSETVTADYASPSRPKLSLPRSSTLTMNGDAQFHPLPPDVNNAILAQLEPSSLFGLSPVGTTVQSSPALTLAGLTPLSNFSTASGYKHSGASDYFGKYPDIEPYPGSPVRQTFGIMGPAQGEVATDSMQVDGGSAPVGHGPHCRSIPQLCVRYNEGTSSDLWATCPDCGACSKVESSQPSANLCHSP